MQFIPKQLNTIHIPKPTQGNNKNIQHKQADNDITEQHINK